MVESSGRVTFGAFIGPYHKVGLDPTVALRRDLELIQHLDRLGFDEAWIGEHHSGGVEIVSSPEIFIAAAAERTSRIKLGTGVMSLPYHHPFMAADRLSLLDHLTRGRMMFGAGPGQLADDSRSMGIDPLENRFKMEQSLEVIIRLLNGETVTRKTDWFTCDEARLQLRPYSKFDVAVTATVSPNGPKLAGRHGAGMLSLAATDPVAVELLQAQWAIAEAEAEVFGQTVSRSKWRLVGPMHLAETEAQARADMRYGLVYLMNYLAQLTPGRKDRSITDTDKLIDLLTDSGVAVIGTPEMAVEQIRRLQDKSGGFGCYLNLQADFAPHAATLRSYELIAEEVAPHFNGSLESLAAGYNDVLSSNYRAADITAEAQRISRARFEAERDQRP
jgi:limonene 1,2-monooxygenase